MGRNYDVVHVELAGWNSRLCRGESKVLYGVMRAFVLVMILCECYHGNDLLIGAVDDLVHAESPYVCLVLDSGFFWIGGAVPCCL